MPILGRKAYRFRDFLNKDEVGTGFSDPGMARFGDGGSTSLSGRGALSHWEAAGTGERGVRRRAGRERMR